MINHTTDDIAGLSRQLSKLIAALERQRQEELGHPAVLLTEQALQQTRRLLAGLRAGRAAWPSGWRSLGDYLGATWVDQNPWVVPHLGRLAAGLSDLAAGTAIPPTSERQAT